MSHVDRHERLDLSVAPSYLPRRDRKHALKLAGFAMIGILAVWALAITVDSLGSDRSTGATVSDVETSTTTQAPAALPPPAAPAPPPQEVAAPAPVDDQPAPVQQRYTQQYQAPAPPPASTCTSAPTS